LHPQRKTVFAGPVIFTPDKVEKLIEATKQWWDNVKADEAMIQVATVGPDGEFDPTKLSPPVKTLTLFV
jgi:hypothetical protein